MVKQYVGYSGKNGFRAMSTDDNSPYFNDVNVGTNFDIDILTPTPLSNVATIQISAIDSAGEQVISSQFLYVFLSNDPDGFQLAIPSPTGTVVATEGEVVGTLTAKLAFIVQAYTSGLFKLQITDSANTGYYICVQSAMTGQVFVSRQLTAADYGN